MLRYYITDRAAIGGTEALLRNVDRVCRAGIEYLQIREKDLTARELLDLVERIVGIARPHAVRVLVNDRADVALAAGADGVHLPARSVRPRDLRAIVPEPSLIGVSCHSAQEALWAAEGGADFVVLGPIFDTPSKRSYGPPLGLAVLRATARQSPVPVLALGGVRWTNAPACLAAGAAGIAAITLFQADAAATAGA